MISNCANPGCRKPLHYLRGGRVFLFNVPVGQGENAQRLPEHYWLCADCAPHITLVKDERGDVRVAYRPAEDPESVEPPPPIAA